METVATLGNQRVLIIDDEQSIRDTLVEVFQDEGFLCFVAASGVEALELLAEIDPAIVFLDIWMPGMDGIEVLQKIKLQSPDLPVVMISGHATIATAMRATKLGAADFIEKPLDLDHVIESAKRALNIQATNTTEPSALLLQKQQVLLNKLVFSEQKAKGQARRQKTLASSAIVYGHGVHTGQKSGLLLEPLAIDSGIHFASVAFDECLPAHTDYVDSTGWATTLKHHQIKVGTIEHLMSALHAYGISNLLIKCNGEVPVMDGSSIDFCKLFDEIGVVEQEQDTYAIKIDQTIRLEEGDKFIQIEPADSFSINYKLIYPAPLGTQEISFELSSHEAYSKEIAPARTFGFLKDIGYLQQKGLAQGGRFDNFVLYGPEGAINSKLRYADEAVRHKVLDCIGDLYLLGRPLQGKVTACMTGHSDNIKLLSAIKEKVLDK